MNAEKEDMSHQIEEMAQKIRELEFEMEQERNFYKLLLDEKKETFELNLGLVGHPAFKNHRQFRRGSRRPSRRPSRRQSRLQKTSETKSNVITIARYIKTTSM